MASMRWTTTPAGSGGVAHVGRIGQQLGEPGAERLDALAGRRGQGDDRKPVGLALPPEGRPRLGRRRQVQLVERDEHRLREERRVVRLQLVADDLVVPLGIARRPVHDVDQDPRPLDVAQELVPEPERPRSRPR